jgi:hypothetical protein
MAGVRFSGGALVFFLLRMWGLYSLLFRGLNFLGYKDGWRLRVFGSSLPRQRCSFLAWILVTEIVIFR